MLWSVFPIGIHDFSFDVCSKQAGWILNLDREADALFFLPDWRSQ